MKYHFALNACFWKVFSLSERAGGLYGVLTLAYVSEYFVSSDWQAEWTQADTLICGMVSITNT